MKAVLFTGMFVLLLLAAPAQTYALGLAEYGQEAAKADQPVLQLSRLNTLAEYFRGWQPGPAAHSFREMVPLFFRVSQLLLAGALLTGCWLGRRRSFRKYLVKARRAVQHLRSGVHAGAC
ncbi:MAG: hypothetical protein ICV83_04640 [Cytophagales bacterium]|nr:hypothetical protein [Cytophagales bacterium]